MISISSNKLVGKRDTFTVLVNRRRRPQTAVAVCRADLSRLYLFVGVRGTLQRATRCLLHTSEILEAGLSHRVEEQLLGVAAACPETGSVTNASSRFEQITGILVELELCCAGDRADKAGGPHLTTANSDVLVRANSNVEKTSRGRGGAGGRGGA